MQQHAQLREVTEQPPQTEDTLSGRLKQVSGMSSPGTFLTYILD